MKTTFANKTTVQRNWYLVDAKDQTLGRLATKIADLLRGKNKPYFSPHVDCGDFVVVINAGEVKLTGNKENQKIYYHHTQFPGGLRETPISKLRIKKPNEILKRAVNGMLPKNKLRKEFMSKLKLFSGAEHNHEAQKPTQIDL